MWTWQEWVQIYVDVINASMVARMVGCIFDLVIGIQSKLYCMAKFTLEGCHFGHISVT